jgi:hypothetical protein
MFWMLIALGIGWGLFSLAILQLHAVSIWSIAIVTGVVLLAAAAEELLVAAVVPDWRWVHAGLGVLFAAGGVLAFAWPSSTFVTVSRLFAWYLLFKGLFDVMHAFATRHQELWWVQLIAGSAQIAIAFWAAGYPGRSGALLVLWIAFGALARSLTAIGLAFALRAATAAAEREADHSYPGTVPTPARHREDVSMHTMHSSPAS